MLLLWILSVIPFLITGRSRRCQPDDLLFSFDSLKLQNSFPNSTTRLKNYVLSSAHDDQPLIPPLDEEPLGWRCFKEPSSIAYYI
jgi:hypothetical protein